MIDSDFFFADKPAGCTTHTSHGSAGRTSVDVDPNDGFQEHLETRLGLQLYTAHRLDRETSGALIFAKTAAAAEELRNAFATREVHKSYLFVTDRKRAEREFVRESLIERDGKLFVSRTDSEANSRTHFRWIRSDAGLSLWEARPETGRSHQIRLHAEDAGIPILGDSLHGGSNFPALSLHSAELQWRDLVHTSPAPRYFENLEFCLDRNLVRWLAAVDRRERLLRNGLPRSQTYRWIHTEGDPLRAEQLGDVYSLSWFASELAPADEASLKRLREILGWNRWYLQIRGNRGQAPNTEEVVRDGIPDRWTSEELGLRFEFRTDSGLSPGLFLDQRQNRRWIREEAQGKRVLNLFCYTGGFSVAAAAGGAKSVVSVDLSRTFLDWARTNFALNGLQTDAHEFRAIDSREYLAWAKKKGLKFDVVICDPPSFGRSKSGVFKLEKDFGALVQSCLDVTAAGGRLLMSSNFENWDEKEFAKRVDAACPRSARLERTPSPDWDFELPHHKRNMKSLFVVRNGESRT